MAENLDNKDLQYMTDKQSEYSSDIDIIFKNNDDEENKQIVIPSSNEKFSDLAENTFVDDDFFDEDLDFVDSIQEELDNTFDVVGSNVHFSDAVESDEIVELPDKDTNFDQKDNTTNISTEDIFSNFESISSFLENAQGTSKDVETEKTEQDSALKKSDVEIKNEEKPSIVEISSEQTSDSVENAKELKIENTVSLENNPDSTELDLSDSSENISLKEEEYVLNITNSENTNENGLNSEISLEEEKSVDTVCDNEKIELSASDIEIHEEIQPVEVAANAQNTESSDTNTEVAENMPPSEIISDEEIMELSDSYDEIIQEDLPLVKAVSDVETPYAVELDENQKTVLEPEISHESVEESNVSENISDNQTDTVTSENNEELNEVDDNNDIDTEDAIIIKKDAPVESIEIIVPEGSASEEISAQDSQTDEPASGISEVVESEEIPVQDSQTDESVSEVSEDDAIVPVDDIPQLVIEETLPETIEEITPSSAKEESTSVNDNAEISDGNSSYFEIIEEDEKVDIISLDMDNTASIIEGLENKPEIVNEASEQVSLDNIENFTLSNEPDLIISENSSEDEITEVVQQKTPEEEYLDENVFAVCSIDDNRGFYFAKNEQTYALFGYLNDDIILLKDFQELYDKNMGIRLEERKFYSESYLVKANSFKFLVEVDETSMKIVMEL